MNTSGRVCARSRAASVLTVVDPEPVRASFQARRVDVAQTHQLEARVLRNGVGVVRAALTHACHGNGIRFLIGAHTYLSLLNLILTAHSAAALARILLGCSRQSVIHPARSPLNPRRRVTPANPPVIRQMLFMIGPVATTCTWKVYISIRTPLFVGQLGEHRQRNARGGVLFGIGERAGQAGVFAPRETFLLVDGNGVMRLGVDAVLLQVIQQPVAVRRVFGLDLVQVVDVAVTRAGVGQVDEVAALQPLRRTGGRSGCAGRSTRGCAAAWRSGCRRAGRPGGC